MRVARRVAWLVARRMIGHHMVGRRKAGCRKVCWASRVGRRRVGRGKVGRGKDGQSGACGKVCGRAREHQSMARLGAERGEVGCRACLGACVG